MSLPPLTAPRRSRKRGRWLPKLRLRHKLAISLSVAALLPVLVASWVAINVVFRSLSSGIESDAERQVAVGLNLLLRNVERLGQVGVQVSTSSRLAEALAAGPDAVAEILARQEGQLPSSLVQVANRKGELIAQHVIGGARDRFSGLGVAEGDAVLEAALKYERRLTFAVIGDEIVVRASAPIVDDSYELTGALVLTVPLDAQFADGLKGALGSNVLIFGGGDAAHGRPGPAASTFLEPDGARVRELSVPPVVAARVARGRTSLAVGEILGQQYTIAYAPLYDIGGNVVGVFAVAVDRARLVEARGTAFRSLVLGAAGAFVFAIGLAGLLSRRITRPIARLHEGALAIAHGNLDHRFDVAEGDEIGDLAAAFSTMTEALQRNERRLAARVSEIVALHDAGRAVSSVLALDQVLRTIVDQVARVLSARVCAMWLVQGEGLRLGAVRAKESDLRTSMIGGAGPKLAGSLEAVARETLDGGKPIRRGPDHGTDGARPAEIGGALIAIPLESRGAIEGVIVAARPTSARPFSEADQNLVATFADQAAAAIDNARLYDEVRRFNEELEAKVHQRTAELIQANQDLERAISELQEAQAQLVLSERLAGLGQLVAGVAHEINSPTAAIAGTIDAFESGVARVTGLSGQLGRLGLSEAERQAFTDLADEAAGVLRNRPIPSPVVVRRTAKQLRLQLVERGIDEGAANDVARSLADIAPEPELLARLGAFIVPAGIEADSTGQERARVLTEYLRAHVYLHRGAHTIHASIRRIQRIVGGLKSYSHLDQQARIETDIHDGIENTLVILEHLLGHGIHVRRRYAELPHLPVFVDELNQVWTNLLHNAIQALGQAGNIVIETEQDGGTAVVRIIDDGPGIPPENLAKIFEPFYTTKPKGEGTGLGLRIVKQIVDKHRGSIECTSEAGRTCFEVRLPIERPEAAQENA